MQGTMSTTQDIVRSIEVIMNSPGNYVLYTGYYDLHTCHYELYTGHYELYPGH